MILHRMDRRSFFVRCIICILYIVHIRTNVLSKLAVLLINIYWLSFQSNIKMSTAQVYHKLYYQMLCYNLTAFN